jgi:hypothetical protein
VNLLPVRLVEAISRDVSTQLLKVLGTRRLMYIPYEEFEKVMAQCSEVFTTWDDEYDKLQGLMRDIVKKKRDEHLKMVWRVNCSHKRLQVRQRHKICYVTAPAELWIRIRIQHFKRIFVMLLTELWIRIQPFK